MKNLHTGSSYFPCQFKSKILSLKLLLHVPTITKNLLSVSKFAANNNVFFEFFLKCRCVKDQATNQVLMAGRLKDSLYVFNPPRFVPNTQSLTINSSDNIFNDRLYLNSEQSFMDSTELSGDTAGKTYSSVYSSSSSSFTLWHNRLDHPGSSVVKVVSTNCNVPNNNEMNTVFFLSMLSWKNSKATFSIHKKNEYPTPLHLIHTNRWGPSLVPSSNGYRYYINFVDDCTKYT